MYNSENSSHTYVVIVNRRHVIPHGRNDLGVFNRDRTHLTHCIDACGRIGGCGLSGRRGCTVVIRALFEMTSINKAATPLAHLLTLRLVRHPYNSTERIFMAVGPLLFFCKFFARRPMTGQPAGETERTEAVTCPG